MNVKQIVERYLKANGFDGLCGEDCGCTLGSSLFNCEGEENCQMLDCAPGYKHWVAPCDRDFFANEWMLTEEKPDESQN